jgi:hypothetical protein
MRPFNNEVMEHVTKEETEARVVEITPFEAEMLAALLEVAKSPGYLDWTDLERAPLFR